MFSRETKTKQNNKQRKENMKKRRSIAIIRNKLFAMIMASVEAHTTSTERA